MRAVVLSMTFFFLLFGSYSVIKPVRDAMGTVYGMDNIQELFTGTFIVSFLVAPLYSWMASRVKLSTFLPSLDIRCRCAIDRRLLCGVRVRRGRRPLGGGGVLHLGEHIQHAHYLGVLDIHG